MRFSIIAASLVSLLFFGCDVGSVVDLPDNPNPGTDGGGAVTGDGGLIAIQCQEIPDGLGSGEHMPGTACLDCHDGGDPEAPLFTVAGTLYKAADGMEASPAGQLKMVDAEGQEIILTSLLNGNFYTDQAVTLPLTNSVTNCGGERTMAETSDTGDCNSCHSGQERIY